jgi:hypothetical protein
MGPGLLTARQVVAGDVVVRNLAGRNHNFAVECSIGRSMIVKSGYDDEGIERIEREARVLGALMVRDAAMRPYLPPVLLFDEKCLVLEMARPSTGLSPHLGARPARQLGAALARAHRAGQVFSPADSGLPTSAPWVLSVHRPDLTTYRMLSSATCELIAVLQTLTTLTEALDRLRDTWKPVSLIHGDVKASNVLVGPTPTNRPTVIDWESAQFGEPAWDVGSIFAIYLSTWIGSMSSMTSVDARAMEGAIEPLRPSIRAAWHSYARRAELIADARSRLLHRATDWMAARLTQTGVELSQQTSQAPQLALLHLQVAQNVIERPEDARTLLSLVGRFA